jgi:hypothetical protein
MPALLFHVATPELQYPEPVLNALEPNQPKKLLPIDYPVDIQAARKEIIDVFTKSIEFLQDSDSICSSHTHSSMPPLEEMSVSSDSGSDMDLESVHWESRKPTTTRTSGELMQIEKDIFGGSESSLEEMYAEPSHLARET